jgi:hypothetical protein
MTSIDRIRSRGCSRHGLVEYVVIYKLLLPAEFFLDRSSFFGASAPIRTHTR